MVGLLGHIDLALAQACQQFHGRQIDQLNLMDFIENAVRDRLAHDDAGNLGDDIIETFQMLDVNRSVDINASGKQLFDILIAFGMA